MKFKKLLEDAAYDKLGSERYKAAQKYIQNEIRKARSKYQKEFNISTQPKYIFLGVGQTHKDDWHEFDYEPPSAFSFYDEEGLNHRLNGPSLIARHGVSWRVHGKLHRTDGPAVVSLAQGAIEFWVNGKKMTREEFLKHFDIKSEP